MPGLEPNAASLLAALPCPALLLSAKGACLARNGLFESLFTRLSGFCFDELVLSFPSYLDSRQAFNFTRLLAKLAQSEEEGRPGQVESFEASFPLADSTRLFLRFRLGAALLPLENTASRAGQELVEKKAEKNRLFLCLIDDISEQKRREEGLIAAKEEAQRAMAVRSSFLANMSHEIRTPIQTILGLIELVGETKLDHEQEEYLRQVSFAADILLTLINDILDFSKIDAGKLSLESIDFNLRDCVEMSADMISLEAHRKGLELVLDISPQLPPIMNGDPARLRQVIVNLVKNAVKFTPHGEVLISAFPLQDSSGTKLVRIEVADTGIGVSPEIRSKLFTSFYQADSSHTRKYGGTGLGLSIAKQLIERMGGRIGIKEEVSQGSVFFFEIPISNASFALPEEEASLRGRLLVVDDRFSARRALCALADTLGMEAEGIGSGSLALDRLEEAAGCGKAFDFCVIDQNMPGMDGWRLASEISAKENLKGIKLILMSPEGTIGPEAKMKLLDWFSGYVTKPVKSREFKQAILKASGADSSIDPLEELSSALDDGERNLVSARVLIAEDHPVNQALFKVILERCGCETQVAQDGAEAVELNRQSPFDIIFMDIQMPRMNGYEATQAIRRSGSTMPIIAVTAHAGKDERERCLQSGMNDILTKPFRKKDIQMMLGFWVKHGLSFAEGKLEAGTGRSETEQDKRFQDREVLDLDAVIETFLGNRDIVLELLVKFMDRTKESVRSIDKAADAADFETVTREAHSIKGSALNLSAQRMGQAALVLEKAAKAADEKGTEEAVERLREEFFEFAQYAQYFVTQSL